MDPFFFLLSLSLGFSEMTFINGSNVVLEAPCCVLPFFFFVVRFFVVGPTSSCSSELSELSFFSSILSSKARLVAPATPSFMCCDNTVRSINPGFSSEAPTHASVPKRFFSVFFGSSFSISSSINFSYSCFSSSKRSASSCSA